MDSCMRRPIETSSRDVQSLAATAASTRTKRARSKKGKEFKEGRTQGQHSPEQDPRKAGQHCLFFFTRVSFFDKVSAFFKKPFAI